MPNARLRHLGALHRAQAIHALPRTKEGEPGQSLVHPQDVLDREDPDCEPCERQDSSTACTRSLHAVCVSLVLSVASGLPAEHARYEWTSWSLPSPSSLSCRYLGVPIPALRSLANFRRYGWQSHASVASREDHRVVYCLENKPDKREAPAQALAKRKCWKEAG